MSEGSFWPKTWKEAIPLIVWGILIFAAGFEGIAALVHAEWLSSLASFVIMVGLTAMLLHGKTWLASINPNWLVGAVIVALTVITFSPFMDRWPFSLAPRLKTYSLVPTKLVIRVTDTRPFLRNKENGLPFSVNIYMISDEPLTEVFLQDDLLTPIGEISPELMKSNFEHLRTIADLASDKAPELGMAIEPKREGFRTVRRAVFTDSTLDSILKGNQRLYVLALWKYKLQGSSDFNVKYLCIYYVNTLDLANTCPGPYNGTFAYKEQ